MAWVIDLRPGDVLTINGALIGVKQKSRIALLNHARVILPNGTVVEPPEPQKESENG